MDELKRKSLEKIANAIKGLSIDAVQKANSGHPGMPLGCAEFAAFMWGEHMVYNPDSPKWMGRDRFVLSAGHASILLYSALFLSGYNLSLEDIQAFRQLHSKTPGHPEYGMTPGVEATTGPLGQGVANAVGHALGLKMMASRIGHDGRSLFNQKVFCLCGDGCMMEGVTSEAVSLAGHLSVDNLVLIYDSNGVCLDGAVSESFSENVAERFHAYGWDVFSLDGYNFDEMEILFNRLRKKQENPTLIIMQTIIGKGSPGKAGSNKAHGSPLGVEESKKTKECLGLSQEPFYVPAVVKEYFQNRKEQMQQAESQWKEEFRNWIKQNPTQGQIFMAHVERAIPINLEKEIQALQLKEGLSGRAASQECLQALGEMLPFLVGGSADLSGSDCTMLKNQGLISSSDFSGGNIKYGVREFGMAAIAIGIYQTDLFLPFIGTFLTFSDYMRNALRIASLSNVQVIYQFTHDSVLLGEDGPTHQPVEHIASLRAIPGLQVIRPADSREVQMAWVAALRHRGPTALLLSRQSLPSLRGGRQSFDEGVGLGGYILKEASEGALKVTLLASGSEVSLAMEVADALETYGHQTRVVSMPCWELFEAQPREYQESILGEGMRVSIEAGVTLGWHKWLGANGFAIGIDTFGASAPVGDIREEFGLSVESILQRVLQALRQ